MNPAISVIMPCYHVEEYLPDIISDFDVQTFQDIEIILVNDGGGDKQLKTMTHLKEKNEKIIIIDKPNGGLPSARNAGLMQAKGEYVVFVDPDDRVIPFFLQKLLEAITSENTDVAVGGFVIHYTKEGRKVEDFLNVSDLPVDGNKRIEYLLSISTVRNAVWNKIYRTAFLKECQCRFNEGLFYSEDEEFNMRILLKTNRITLIPDSGYVYMCRDSNSICSKYVEGYKEARELAISLREQVMRKIGMSDEEIHKVMLEDYYLLGYFMVCNLLKKRSPLSYKERKKYVAMHVLNNPTMTEAFKKRNSLNDNLFTKVYNQCFKWHSAFLMVYTFRLLYGLKYNFMGCYIALAPYLKQYKK